MGKVIAVWGASGAGKSTLSGLLARYYAERGMSVIIMSFDSVTPMMPIWLPTREVSQGESLGAALSEKTMSVDVIMTRVQPYNPNPNIGFMAYTSEDNCFNYTYDYKNVCDAIKLAKNCCQILILDCASSFSDISVPAAIELSDKTICVLKPDLASASYYRANSELLSSASKFHLKDHIKVFNQIKPFHAVKEMDEAIGDINFYFKYDPNIENSMLSGDAVNTLQFCRDKTEYKTFFKTLEKTGVMNNGKE